MLNMLKGIRINILKNKGLIAIILLVFSLLIPSVFTPLYTEAVKKSTVLEIVPKPQFQILTPTIIVTPTPTIPVPTATPVPASAVSSPTPTVIPTPTPVSVATPTSTPTPSSIDTPTLTPTLAPTVTPTETPIPTPAGLKIQIGIDYAEQKPPDSYTTSINSGQTAWDAVVAAVGINNLQYTDYGGSLGIFITGFNGINAASNQYFEFEINGVSSNVGVSTYKCSDGDKLDFVLTTF